MCFALTMDCPCCRDFLHHCKKCWNKFHNGEKDEDYVPPKYYGESMMNEETAKKCKELGFELKPTIKADKNRKYKEGEYH